MDKTIRIGIVGTGIIGKAHLETYSKMPGVELVAACDINAPELDRVAERYKIPCKYANFRDLLKHKDIDAVDVCLHNNLHAPVTIAALEAGKDVYCEKPMAGAYTDARRMLDTARKCRRKLSIQLNTLLARETQVARRLIEAGKLGRIYHARSAGFRRRGRPYVDGYATANFVQKNVAGGGALYDMGVYHIAQVLFLLGLPKLERISGRTFQETSMDAGRRAASRYSVEELGLGLARFSGGIAMEIIESWAIHLDGLDSSYIVGSEGGLRLSPLSFHTTSPEDLELNTTFETESILGRWHSLNSRQVYYDSSQSHWIGALRGAVDLLPSAETALLTMLVSEGIYLSEKLRREVTADEIMSRSKSTAVKL
ncbi:MAG: Gfo/Idh/MocA family oxidoreductase [Phycisphaerae bacterium]|nr:Gfo/Idh/MocA family oxidoreductase [Phycisphaerae bacterium]